MPEKRGVQSNGGEAHKEMSLLEKYPTESAFIDHLVSHIEQFDGDESQKEFESLTIYYRLMTRSIDGGLSFLERVKSKIELPNLHLVPPLLVETLRYHPRFIRAVKPHLQRISESSHLHNSQITAGSLRDSFEGFRYDGSSFDPIQEQAPILKTVESLEEEGNEKVLGNLEVGDSISIFREMDNYYAEVLGSRKPSFIPARKRERDVRSTGMRIAEAALRDVERVLPMHLSPTKFTRDFIVPAVPDFEEKLRAYYEREIAPDKDLNYEFGPDGFEKYKKRVMRGIPQQLDIPREVIEEMLTEHGVSDVQQLAWSAWGPDLTEEIAVDVIDKLNLGKEKSDPGYIDVNDPETEKKLSKCVNGVWKQFYQAIRGEGASLLKREIRKFIPKHLELYKDEESGIWKLKEKKEELEEEESVREEEEGFSLSFTEADEGQSIGVDPLERSTSKVVAMEGSGKYAYTLFESSGGQYSIMFPHLDKPPVLLPSPAALWLQIENESVIIQLMNGEIMHIDPVGGSTTMVDTKKGSSVRGHMRKVHDKPNVVHFAEKVIAPHEDYYAYYEFDFSTGRPRAEQIGTAPIDQQYETQTPTLWLDSGDTVEFKTMGDEHFLVVAGKTPQTERLKGEVHGIPWTDGTNVFFVTHNKEKRTWVTNLFNVYRGTMSVFSSSYPRIERRGDYFSARTGSRHGDNDFLDWFSKNRYVPTNINKSDITSPCTDDKGRISPLITSVDSLGGTAKTTLPDGEVRSSPPVLSLVIEEGSLKQVVKVADKLFYVINSVDNTGEYVYDEDGKLVELPGADTARAGGVIERLEEHDGYVHYSIMKDGILRHFMKPIGELVKQKGADDVESEDTEPWYAFKDVDAHDFLLHEDKKIVWAGGSGQTSFAFVEDDFSTSIVLLDLERGHETVHLTLGHGTVEIADVTIVDNRHIVFLGDGVLTYLDTQNPSDGFKCVHEYDEHPFGGGIHLNNENGRIESYDGSKILSVSFEDGIAHAEITKRPLGIGPEDRKNLEGFGEEMAWFDSRARAYKKKQDDSWIIVFQQSDGSRKSSRKFLAGSSIRLANTNGRYATYQVYTPFPDKNSVIVTVDDQGNFMYEIGEIIDNSASNNQTRTYAIDMPWREHEGFFGYSDLGQMRNPRFEGGKDVGQWIEYETTDGKKGIALMVSGYDEDQSVAVEAFIQTGDNTSVSYLMEAPSGYYIRTFSVIQGEPYFVVRPKSNSGDEFVIDKDGNRTGIFGKYIHDIRHEGNFVKVLISDEEGNYVTLTKKIQDKNAAEVRTEEVNEKEKTKISNEQLKQLFSFSEDEIHEYDIDEFQTGISKVGGAGKNAYLCFKRGHKSVVVFPERNKTYKLDSNLEHIYVFGNYIVFLSMTGGTERLEWTSLDSTDEKMLHTPYYDEIVPESVVVEGNDLVYTASYNLQESRMEMIRIRVNLHDSQKISNDVRMLGRSRSDGILLVDQKSADPENQVHISSEFYEGDGTLTTPDGTQIDNVKEAPFLYCKDGRYFVGYVSLEDNKHHIMCGAGKEEPKQFGPFNHMQRMKYNLGAADAGTRVYWIDEDDDGSRIYFLVPEFKSFRREGSERWERVSDGGAFILSDSSSGTVVAYDKDGSHTNEVSDVFIESSEGITMIQNRVVGTDTKKVFDESGNVIFELPPYSDSHERIRKMYEKDGYLHLFTDDGQNGSRGKAYIKKIPDSFFSVDQEQEPHMNTDVQRRLDLLNLLDNYNLAKLARDPAFDDAKEKEVLAAIDAYNAKYRPKVRKRSVDLPESVESFWDEMRGEIRDYLETSPTFVKQIALTLGADPKPFLDTMAAVPSSGTDAQVDRFLRLIYPEYWQEKQRKEREKAIAEYERRPDPNAYDYLTVRDVNGIAEANPEDRWHQEIVQMREYVDRFIVGGGMFGEYDEGAWKRVEFPVDPDLDDPVKQYTFSLPFIEDMQEIVLPRILGAQIIADRVKGVDSKGDEVELSVDIKPSGYTIVKLDGRKKFEKVVYSQRASELPQVPDDVSDKEYARFKKMFTSHFSEKMTERLGQLPPWAKSFIHSLEGKTPVEKIQAIESFVRSVGYYDFQNAETEGQKEYKTFDERLAVMQYRLDTLKGRDPELASQLTSQQVAGVCADFGILAIALLREAGFVAGYLSGFRPESNQITTGDAHGVAYVVWPNSKGKGYKVYAVDGTPGGVTEVEKEVLSHIQRPSLEEKAVEKKQVVEHLVEQSEEQLAEMEKELAEMSPEVISKLKNGELEKTVNTVLRYSVRPAETMVLHGLLSAAVYGPKEYRDLENEKKMKRFLTGQVKGEHDNPTKAHVIGEMLEGKNMFDLVKYYVPRLTLDLTDVTDIERRRIALERLEKMVNLVKEEFTKNELRAITAIITYLKAEQMVNEGNV